MSVDFGYENDLQEDDIDGRHNENQNTNSQHQNSSQECGRNGPIDKEQLIKGVECSARSTKRFTVRFVNTTDHCVDVIWLDFEGQPVTYETLQPQTAWSVYTYEVEYLNKSNPPSDLHIFSLFSTPVLEDLQQLEAESIRKSELRH